MTAPISAKTPCVAVFDLDGTLTWRDTLWPFLAGYLLRHPARLFCLWRLPLAALAFGLLDSDRGVLKSRVIRMVLGGATRTAIDAWADSFVHALPLRHSYRPGALRVLEAHRAAGDHLVLLSASPDLYLPRLGRSLGFERTLCTELEWRGNRLDGKLKTQNRRGEEKLRCLEWLRAQYPRLPIVAYGNSASDLAHLRQADRAILVNANASARALAALEGIPTEEWT